MNDLEVNTGAFDLALQCQVRSGIPPKNFFSISFFVEHEIIPNNINPKVIYKTKQFISKR